MMTGESQRTQSTKTTSEQDPPSSRSLGTIIPRALKLRCPRCGGGRLFHGYFRMFPGCPNCKLRYERAPGYFLGSTYINYGLTTFLVSVVYVLAVFVGGFTNEQVVFPLLVFVILFPLIFFRLARSLWLGMDCYFDKIDFQQSDED